MFFCVVHASSAASSVATCPWVRVLKPPPAVRGSACSLQRYSLSSGVQHLVPTSCPAPLLFPQERASTPSTLLPPTAQSDAAPDGKKLRTTQPAQAAVQQQEQSPVEVQAH